MRRLALLLVLVAACGGDEKKDPAPPAPPPIAQAPTGPPVPWAHALAPGWDLEIHVPKEWSTNRVARLEGAEIHFGGPGVPGKRPELIFGWEPSKLSLDAYSGASIEKFDASPIHTVRQKGAATVAGMNAVYCIVETKVSREIIFYFVGHGHRGFVRGLAPIEDYAKFGPIFQQAAALLRYSPP